jgi:RND family efflux transporter MFP subunit
MTSARPVSLLLACTFLVSAACSSDHTATASPQKGAPPAVKPREVRVTPATELKMARTVAVTGTLNAEEQVVLSMKVTGRLAQLLVDLGTSVRRGDVVARLDPVDFKLRVDQAEAALHQARVRLGLSPNGSDDRVDVEKTSVVRQAKAQLDDAVLTRERTDRLWQQELVARAQLDTAISAEQVAEARYHDALEEARNRQAMLAQRRSELEMARQALVDTVLTAPADGLIRERRTAVGEYLVAGTPVATLVRVHPIRLALAIPERSAVGVRVGQEARVTVEGDSTVYRGRVVRLSPSIQELNRTLNIEAEVPNERAVLRPGSFAKAEIVVGADQQAIFVPLSSIVVFAGIEKVLGVKDGRSIEKRVTTGRKDKDRVEIVEGLTAGEPVVLEPGNLVGGQPVTIVK